MITPPKLVVALGLVGVIADRAVKSAQQSLDISTAQYRGGLANYLQVITAQTSLLQNQRTAVDILTRRMSASVSLIQALGGGWMHCDERFDQAPDSASNN